VGTNRGSRTYYLQNEMTPAADTITQFPLSQRVVWLRYLERTREAGDAYAEVEQAAWEELQTALARIPRSPEDAA
jgi:hypothetical protein